MYEVLNVPAIRNRACSPPVALVAVIKKKSQHKCYENDFYFQTKYNDLLFAHRWHSEKKKFPTSCKYSISNDYY